MYGNSSYYDKISNSIIRACRWGLCITLALILTTNCAPKTNPSYSSLIIAQLDKVATPLYEFYAQIQQGTFTTDYSSLRETHYNAILAEMECLKLKIVSRPNRNPAMQSSALKCYYAKINKPYHTIPYSQLKQSPSLLYIDLLINDWEQLKISDSKMNLSAAKIQTSRKKLSDYLEQIAIYENILNQ